MEFVFRGGSLAAQQHSDTLKYAQLMPTQYPIHISPFYNLLYSKYNVYTHTYSHIDSYIHTYTHIHTYK